MNQILNIVQWNQSWCWNGNHFKRKLKPHIKIEKIVLQIREDKIESLPILRGLLMFIIIKVVYTNLCSYLRLTPAGDLVGDD